MFAAGTAVIFYIIWAAMHDIAHQETNTTFEWTALVLTVPAFVLVYSLAVSRLNPRALRAWLAGTTLLTGLFAIGAIDAILNPKYPPDPQLGVIFLIAAVPVLVLLGYHLVTKTQRR